MVAKTRTRRAGVEWIGGLASMPAYVTEDEETYRPELLLWMGEGGALLGTALAKPGELLGGAADSLRSTIERPMVGRPHAPARVRVSSPALADALRTALPAIDVVCAPTPELDDVLDMMRERFAADDEDTEPSYLGPGIDPSTLGSFFDAAAGLFRAAPWKVVPSDNDLFSVTIESLGVQEAAMSVIGQLGESFGLILFASVDDFEAFGDAAEAIENGEEPALPAHLALNFERGANFPVALRKEIAEYGWAVAGADAFPWLTVVDDDLVGRPPTAREIAVVEAVALALTKLIGDDAALSEAFDGGEPVARTSTVQTRAGEVEVTLRVPCERPWSPAEVLAELEALEHRDDEIDPDSRKMLEEALLDAFADSPEAKRLTDVGSYRFIMDLAAEYLGATIATLDRAGLREILFELVPREVAIDAAEARGLIEEQRAFYAFLKRACGLPQADACIRLLRDDAVRELEAALSDPSKFGEIKAMVIDARNAGFDLSTPEGVESWMRSKSSPPSRDQSRSVQAKQKRKRKAARAARRRNR